ncbi:MAG: hypothetical protein F4Z68_00520 [Nitrospira sp. SB0667_bin_9]|nr:hypothetical protein [Nitrospira sp. SB0667_bin_9]MYD31261.1 hypothetical protein [Nitrospira sp. SB0661_bin_20]
MPKKPFDPVVKIGLTVLLGGLTLIGGGMFLSRPDRTIPPFSIGGQEGTVVAVHVPAWTSDPDIETLIRRFRNVGETHHDFRSMKVRPTTPDDPETLYREVVLYVFSDPQWTQPEPLHRYLTARGIAETGSRPDDQEEAFRQKFERSARAGFIYSQGRTKGWLGPIPDPSIPEQRQNIQILFDDLVPFSPSPISRIKREIGRGQG